MSQARGEDASPQSDADKTSAHGMCIDDDDDDDDDDNDGDDKLGELRVDFLHLRWVERPGMQDVILIKVKFIIIRFMHARWLRPNRRRCYYYYYYYYGADGGRRTANERRMAMVRPTSEVKR
ncbi:hypothetical protein TEQG_06341 [Trichophyton equinum CBS 127.97]|uniref:Uncharacterized protein n=1 Tax=Trichophyton equinum (strain ATCC MYA-4606 / CBS 127.97) TaxID=559882 RepID=F2PZN8_TRIEC|nr:hypothetical protein TEQG_06341 [Trichophyton equinum CBS 127.97]